ncbi:MAG: GAF domain-containing protein [Anaerolineales bacterium]|nr:GAF domain-containing protein [Anaerolineales bacterium]
MTTLRVLLVEDFEDDALLIVRELQRAGYELEFERVATSASMRDALVKKTWDVVIADYALPKFSGLAALKLMQDTGLDLPFIIVSGTIGEELAVGAMKAGAHDYLMKGELTRLVPAVNREIQEALSRQARRTAEEELWRLKEFNEEIVQNIFDGIIVDNLDGEIAFVNPAAAYMLGYQADELIGKKWHMIVPKDQRSVVARAVRRRKQGVSDRYELQMLRKDGSRIYTLVSGSPRLSGGKFTGTMAVFTDITARKQSEATLQRRAEELAALHAASLKITSPHDYESLLHTIVIQAVNLLEAQGGTVLVCDDDKQIVRVLDEYHLDEREIFHGVTMKFGEGAAGLVAQTGKPLIIDDYRVWNNRAAIYEDQQPYTAVLSVPMSWHSKVTGVLQVVDEIERRRFTQEDSELLSLFADQAAIALENMRLLEVERGIRERAEALRDAAAVFGFTLSLEQVVQAVLDQLRRVLHFDSGSTMLVEDGRIVFQTWWGFDQYADISILKNISFDLATDQTCGEVVRSGKPLVICNVKQDPRWQVTTLGAHINSWLGVPLWVRDRVIGLLSLDRTSPDGFSEEEIVIAQTFALHSAVAIENARHFEAEEQRATELLALRQASLTLTASLDLEEVLYAMLQSALAFLPGAHNSYIYLYHDDTRRLTFGAALLPDGKRGEPVPEPRQDGLTYTVARTGEVMVIPNMRGHPLFADAPFHWEGAMVGLPLKIGQRVVGVMNISYPQPHRFTDAELRVLGLLGDQAAIAIENASLYKRAATERRHLGLLYDLGRELAATLDHDEVLNRAVTLTCQALGGLVGEGFRYIPDTNRLRLCALYGRDKDVVSEVAELLKLAPGVGLAGWVAQERQPVNVANVLQDTRWLHVPDLDEDARSALMAPIIDGERLLGVISVLHREEGAFSSDHLDLLQAICQQVALALNNADGYQQIQNLVDLLAAEQYRLESLVERLPVGVLLLDSNYRLLIANLFGRQILARMGAGEPGQVLTHLGPYPIAQFCEQFASLEYKDEMPKSSIEFVLSESPRAIFEAEARSIGGDARQWVITLRDITQEREDQERIRTQERLATVGQLAAGIAHDFNNIMAAILVYTDLLIGDKTLASTSRERLHIIQQQVQRATSLIRQILDFSRRSVMEQTPMDLLPFVKELDKMLSRVLPEIIHLELKYQPGVYMIKGDPTRLQQVVMNLAVNARDAMPQGGNLRFDLSRVRITPGAKLPHPELSVGDWVRIGVADDGVGIPPEELSHIFDPFYTTKPVGKGTGLGLAQVYGIVKQHQGFIDVSSQVNMGTEFIIYLPGLRVDERDDAAQEHQTKLDGSGLTVLVVEDDDATREALQALLQAQGFWVITATNGREALKLFEGQFNLIDLVVTDVVMPEMGGVALHQMLRSRWSDIKMLFVTGHPLEMRDQALLEAGDVSWLQKPFTVQELNSAIQALLRK